METQHSSRDRAASGLLLIALIWLVGAVTALFAGRWMDAVGCLFGTLTALLGVGACGLGDEG